MTIRLLQLIVALAALLPSVVGAEPMLLVEPPDEFIDIREVIANADDEVSCQAVRELYADGVSATSVPVAFADLILTGHCLEKDFETARTMLEKASEQYGSNANALARLGWMYEAGIGVDTDRKKAKELFKRAVGAMLPMYSYARRIDPDTPSRLRFGGHRMFWQDGTSYGIAIGHPTDNAEHWGMTTGEAAFNFVDTATGPWELPEALIQERDRLAPLLEGSGEDHIAVASDFRYGSNGYPIDHAVAYAWIDHSASRPTSIAAMRTFLNWIEDPAFCPSQSLRCTASPVLSHSILTNLAATGDPVALRALMECARTSDMPYDYLPELTKQSLADAYPNAGSNQEALEQARADILQKLEDFRTARQGLEPSLDTQSPFLGRQVFGSDLPVDMFFWNKPCPLNSTHVDD